MTIAVFTRGIANLYRCEECKYEWIQSAGIGFHTLEACERKRNQVGGHMLSPETQMRLRVEHGVSEQEFINALRIVFPAGHEDFLPQCVAEMELHSVKSHDYASGGDPLGNFKRVASILGNYKGLDLSDPRVVALVYTMKQIDAVLWSLAQNITAKVEGIVPRLDDVAVYAKIVKCLTVEMARNKSIDEQFGVDGPLKAAMDAQGCDRSEGSLKRVEVSARGRHEVESEPVYRRRMGFDDAQNMKSAVQCPELNKTRDREDTPIGRDLIDGRPIYSGDQGVVGAHRTSSPYDCGAKDAGFNSIRQGRNR